MKNKEDIAEDIDIVLGEEASITTHEKLKPVIDAINENVLNIAPGNSSQDIQSIIKLSGGLAASEPPDDTEVAAFFSVNEGKAQKSNEGLTKLKGDKSYWQKWRRGNNDGVPDIGITRSAIVAAPSLDEAAALWDAARFDNDDLDDDQKGIWSVQFEATDTWGGFFPKIGDVSVSRYIDYDGGPSRVAFVITGSNDASQYQGAYRSLAFEGWHRATQAHNYSNTEEVTVDGFRHLEVKGIVTGVSSADSLVDGQAVTLVSGRNSDNHGIYAPSDSDHFINGVVIKECVDVSGGDCSIIASEPGIYDLDIDTSGQPDHAPLYVNKDDNMVTFTKRENPKTVGYLLTNGQVFLDPTGSNYQTKTDEPPNPEATTLLHFWAATNPPLPSDLDYAMTNSDSDVSSRTTEIPPDQILTTNCISERSSADVEYEFFYMAVIKGVSTLEPNSLFVAGQSYYGQCDVYDIDYNNDTYTVIVNDASNISFNLSCRLERA